MDAFLKNYIPNLAEWGMIWKQHLLASDWLGISVEMVGTLIFGHSSTARVAKACFVPVVRCTILLLTWVVKLLDMACPQASSVQCSSKHYCVARKLRLYYDILEANHLQHISIASGC